MIKKIKKIVTLLLISARLSLAQSPLSPEQIGRIDALFAKYNIADVPGCAVGISRHDSVVLERAWGMAELEHSIPITPATIFEAGSVSKQFTAAAVFRLAQQGKLSLDSSVRKYLPELPAYTQPITLRRMINHTSGFRDWGAVMAMAGWPRGTRTYTQDHVLDIVARQKALNYPVGAEYLYSNTNYNLLAMIVERVSGKSFVDFTRQELFEPLGMKNTGWRDNYKNIVKNRAQAYAGSGKTWYLNMPFENVYGNSSLLTTVGDLLKWNANLTGHRVGGDEFVKLQLEQGKLSTGRTIDYAGGVFVQKFNGTEEIAHDGATAGYRAYLARYPASGYSVALLCNASDANPIELGQGVARIVLPAWTAPARVIDSVGVQLYENKLMPMLGHYRNTRSDEPITLLLENGRVRVFGGPLLAAISETHFMTPSGRTHLLMDAPKKGTRWTMRAYVDGGDTVLYEPVNPPIKRESYDYAGEYYSAEADGAVTVLVEAGMVFMVQRPSDRFALNPIYEDGFSARGSFFKFTRKNGKVTGFLVTAARARNVRFDRKQ